MTKQELGRAKSTAAYMARKDLSLYSMAHNFTHKVRT
jgi:hypothetical protein